MACIYCRRGTATDSVLYSEIGHPLAVEVDLEATGIWLAADRDEPSYAQPGQWDDIEITLINVSFLWDRFDGSPLVIRTVHCNLSELRRILTLVCGESYARNFMVAYDKAEQRAIDGLELQRCDCESEDS